MGLFDIFSNRNSEQAAQDRIKGLNAAYDQASGALNTGATNAQNYYGQALVPFQQLSGYGMRGLDAYSDALGLNGSAGNARAVAAFQNNPGYQTQLNYGLQAIDRGAAARGMLSSGNTAMAEQKFGNDLASTGWNQYLSSFSPFFSLAGQGAQGQAGVYGQQAGTAYDLGTRLADLGWKQQTGIGDANASADLANNGASANAWGAIMNGARLAVSALPFLPSDRRIKTDIKRIGRLSDGLPFYSYRYKGDPTPRMGVMAQDVEKVDPRSVVEVGGVKVVNYDRVSNRAATFDMLRGKAA
ncbi:MAG TPA: tail fiber domain-containing protein [Pseudolabrys sp.]|nr:tail fiber domain-containing protein [Pseudolabrys sp.]